jgi:murein DD-endopeptidase MepM/ murein hydrolase activator NlpD
MRVHRVWLPLVLVVGLCVGADGTGVADPRVDRARDDLRTARTAAAEVGAELDEAAQAYERARAHAERLTAEARANRRNVTRARAAAIAADDVVRSRLMMLFKHPHVASRAWSPDAMTDSVGETLHRVELIEQLTQVGARDRGRADRALGRVRDAEHDYRVVAAGVRDAVHRRRERAADLGAALHRARQRVDDARDDVRQAEAVVAEERARRRRARELALAATRTADVPLPPVEGMVCPLGSPHGFSDTWGAPRSGGRTHQGVDMFAAHGTPQFAVEGGTVRVSNSTLGGLSLHLTTHGGDRYYYAHLSAALVTTGQRVRAGQWIGVTGNTGNARTTPPHLHWQYHPGGGAPVNPYPLALALCRA